MSDSALPRLSARLARLPPGLTPRYLSRAEAAAFVGVSVETFDREVALGWWPPPRRRGEKTRRLTWDIRALEIAADRAAGIGAQWIEAAEIAAAQQMAAEAAAIEGARRAAPKGTRPKPRPSQAA